MFYLTTHSTHFNTVIWRRTRAVLTHGPHKHSAHKHRAQANLCMSPSALPCPGAHSAIKMTLRRTYGIGPSTQRERKPTAYSFRLAARVLIYALSHRQDSIYHSLCTSHGSIGSPWRTTHRTTSERSYHGATSCSRDVVVIMILEVLTYWKLE